MDSDWAGDTVTRRSTSGVNVRRGRHLLRHSSKVQNVSGLSSAQSEYYEGRMLRTGSAKLVCRLEPETTTLIGYRLFEREGSCYAKWRCQEHSSKTDEDAVATGTCSSKTLASCESSNKIKSCRHVDASTWEIENGEPHAKTVEKKPTEKRISPTQSGLLSTRVVK